MPFERYGSDDIGEVLKLVVRAVVVNAVEKGGTVKWTGRDENLLDDVRRMNAVAHVTSCSSTISSCTK